MRVYEGELKYEEIQVAGLNRLINKMKLDVNDPEKMHDVYLPLLFSFLSLKVPVGTSTGLR